MELNSTAIIAEHEKLAMVFEMLERVTYLGNGFRACKRFRPSHEQRSTVHREIGKLVEANNYNYI